MLQSNNKGRSDESVQEKLRKGMVVTKHRDIDQIWTRAVARKAAVRSTHGERAEVMGAGKATQYRNTHNCGTPHSIWIGESGTGPAQLIV